MVDTENGVSDGLPRRRMSAHADGVKPGNDNWGSRSVARTWQRLRGFPHTRSMAIAVASPPPMQSEATPRFLQSNGAIFDGKALFHVDHTNLGSAALSSDAIAAGRLSMKAQKEKDSNEKLGIGPRFLWVPDALEETAYNLFIRTTNNDPDFVESLQLQVRPLWCWTDANDWCLSAATRDVPVIELGLLNGAEEPEVFIQDRPSPKPPRRSEMADLLTTEEYKAIAKNLLASTHRVIRVEC